MENFSNHPAIFLFLSTPSDTSILFDKGHGWLIHKLAAFLSIVQDPGKFYNSAKVLQVLQVLQVLWVPLKFSRFYFRN